MKFRNLFLYFFFHLASLLLSTMIYAQDNVNETNKELNKKYFVTLKTGVQMSGIKSEDFVSNNLSPLINVSFGSWVVPYLALQVSYKGFYFLTISDKNKHYYGFYHGELLFNINSIFPNIINNNKIQNSFHLGSGLFYNFNYQRPNICASSGISSTFKINDYWGLNIEISSIFGWDIYQGDEDILPSIGIGLSYRF